MPDVFHLIPRERSFGAEALHVMGDVFDKIHEQQPSLAPERIAFTILGLARNGQNTESLCAAVLNDLREGRHRSQPEGV
ncbi:MAG TPA: hypothetical protein VFT69_15525 [Pseudolabrys sp.]|jgi:hypothetical protein|nr:hypothetical protein [Pseudolabrys sp.]